MIVDIKGVDLGGLSKALSFIPDISGLCRLMQMYSKNNVIDINGTVNGRILLREERGDLGLGIEYRLSQTEHDVIFPCRWMG